MDKKLSRAVDVLDALDSYFRSLETYIKQTDRDKFTKLEHGIEECRKFKNKFSTIQLDDSGLFQAVHLHASMRKLLADLYVMLDFELPVGEEISKTRAYRLSDVFNKITTIYRTYIRDVVSEANEIVELATTKIITKDPAELQSLWQKWPNSIDLYTNIMTSILNDSYRVKNRELTQHIFEILESDKRFILNEHKWLSPFLTFNCVPWMKTLSPKPWAEFARDLEIDASDETFDGAIVIRREQAQVSVIHLLPKGMEWAKGIVETDIHETLEPLPASTQWNWDVKIHDGPDTQTYYIIERTGEDRWRALVPWKYPGVKLQRDILVHKIKEHAFGRPNAYHEQIERPLRQQLSKRVAVLAGEEARVQDVSLSVLRVTDSIMDELKRIKGETLDRIDSPKLDKIFESAVLEELSRHDLTLLDAVLYWTDWTTRDFRRDLDAAVTRSASEFTTWDAVVENLVETCVHHAVDSQLRKASNVFQDLFNKQHKINEVRTHTRK